MTKSLAAALALTLAAAPLATRADEPAGAASLLSPGTLALAGASAAGFDQSTHKLTDDPKVETSATALQARGLYYFTPNLGVGALLDYGYLTTKVETRKTVVEAFLLGPAVGLDLPLGDRVSFFALVSGGRAWGSTKRTDSGQGRSYEYDARGWGAQALGGLKVFVGRAVSLDAGVGYHWLELEGDDQGYSYTSTDSGFGVNLGVSVYLPTR